MGYVVSYPLFLFFVVDKGKFMSYLRINGQDVELENLDAFLKDRAIFRIDMTLQSAPISAKCEPECINGHQIDVLALLLERIIVSFNDNVPCRENSIVITKLQEARMWLEARTKNRIEREVEGTTNV